MTAYTLDNDNHQELVGLLEDTIEYFCNEYLISGELAWTVTQSLAQAKLEMFKGKLWNKRH